MFDAGKAFAITVFVAASAPNVLKAASVPNVPAVPAAPPKAPEIPAPAPPVKPPRRAPLSGSPPVKAAEPPPIAAPSSIASPTPPIAMVGSFIENFCHFIVLNQSKQYHNEVFMRSI
jgi:hypothetical protein